MGLLWRSNQTPPKRAEP